MNELTSTGQSHGQLTSKEPSSHYQDGTHLLNEIIKCFVVWDLEEEEEEEKEEEEEEQKDRDEEEEEEDGDPHTSTHSLVH